MIEHWPSYLLGLATLPALALLTVTVLLLVARTGSRGISCDVCDWPFAGLRDNMNRIGREPDEALNHPFEVHALTSTFWHDRVISHTLNHRAAWTEQFDTSSAFQQERMLPYAPRMGKRGHTHQVRAGQSPRPDGRGLKP